MQRETKENYISEQNKILVKELTTRKYTYLKPSNSSKASI